MKPTLDEIKDNYERVLLRLHSGELAGIVDDDQPQLQVLRKTHWIDRAMTTSDLDKSYNRKNAITDFYIDAIAFMNDAKQVDNFLRYDECEIDWDWDINNPHNLKFKKGDVVVIDHAENRSAYVRMLGKVGTIVDAEYKQYVDDERITYRVRVDDCPNEYQENGLWVFHKEKSLKLYNPQCDDQLDAYEYAIQKLGLTKVPYNRDYIIKGDKNNMMNEILEIYEDKKLKKINDKYEGLEKSIKLTDPRYKVWLECTTTLDKLYAEDKMCSYSHAQIELSDDTKKKLFTLYNAREKEVRDLYDKKREVNAQLSMCETYEQKQNVLNTYKILKANGKINA